jgi:nucleobindin
MYHNTPETQTDESYNHPEDLEHFAHHEAIERKEAEKEAAYQGITVEEALAQHEHDGEPIPKPDAGQVPLNEGGAPAHPHDDQGDERLAPKYTRMPKPEKVDPVQKYVDAKKGSQSQEQWGEGSGGYKIPKGPGEKLRKNVPYKVSLFVASSSQWAPD